VPVSCACLDCVSDKCDPAFEACAGFSQGIADSGTEGNEVGDGTAGGPPSCETQGYCTGGRGGAGGEGGAGGQPTGACVNAADEAYVCGPGSVFPTIKNTLTRCGLCAITGFACPTDCSGDPIAPYTASADCADRTLLLGGDGGACTEGLSATCLACYQGASDCGTDKCAASCSGTGANGANGCNCIDCVDASCDAAFEACAGYSAGRPNGRTSNAGGVEGGPPACHVIPTPTCIE
jgi:hypothetical protein